MTIHYRIILNNNITLYLKNRNKLCTCKYIHNINIPFYELLRRLHTFCECRSCDPFPGRHRPESVVWRHDPWRG